MLLKKYKLIEYLIGMFPQYTEAQLRKLSTRRLLGWYTSEVNRRQSKSEELNYLLFRS